MTDLTNPFTAPEPAVVVAEDEFELRCPYWPSQLFMVVLEAGPAVIEIACRKCERAAESSALPLRVVHVFRLSDGKCLSTHEFAKQD